MSKEIISNIDLKILMIELEVKRKKMIEVGLKLGLSSSETLKLSQEIDNLHNEIIHLQDK